jgi:hypothetical protein
LGLLGFEITIIVEELKEKIRSEEIGLVIVMVMSLTGMILCMMLL